MGDDGKGREEAELKITTDAPKVEVERKPRPGDHVISPPSAGFGVK